MRTLDDSKFFIFIMSFNKKKIILTKEILFNALGQIVINKNFLSRYINKFYRFNRKGL